MIATAGISRLVKLYVASVVLLSGAAVYLASSMDPMFGAQSGVPIWGILTFVALGLGLELSERHLAIGAAAGSIAFVVYLGAALIFGPTWCVIIASTCLTATNVINRRPPIKTVFNVAQHVLGISVGASVYLFLGGTVPATLPHSVLPFATLAVSYFAINSTAVSGVVALSEGGRFSDVWIKNTWPLIPYDLAASALAIGIVWLYVQFGILGLVAVTVPIAFLRHTYLVNLQLQATNRELLELMVKAIEARDPYTSGHSERVSVIARELAREIGLSYGETEKIATAALLHDVGKIYEDFALLLRKDSRLTPAEKQTMQSHPVRSAELVGTISSLKGYVEQVVRHHHENFDGSGYPDGLAGEHIPIGARIVLIADTTDAITTDRPYRKALTYEKVLSELNKYGGKQFDPQVVAAFLRSAAVRQLIASRERKSAPPRAREQERAERLVVR